MNQISFKVIRRTSKGGERVDKCDIAVLTHNNKVSPPKRKLQLSYPQLFLINSND